MRPKISTCPDCGTPTTRVGGRCQPCSARASHRARRVECICVVCAAPFHVKASLAPKRVTCGRRCAGVLRSRRITGELHPLWEGGVGSRYYRRFIKDSCERCDSVSNLLVHHRDRNQRNNDPANLETLCPVCHQREHGSGMTKIDQRLAEEIRQRYNAGGVSQQHLAREYDVSQATISRVIRQQ